MSNYFVAYRPQTSRYYGFCIDETITCVNANGHFISSEAGDECKNHAQDTGRSCSLGQRIIGWCHEYEEILQIIE